MLEVYRKQFKDITTNTDEPRRTMLLANLMTQMEGFYNLSAVRARFEQETEVEVKELYLSVSNAREL